MIIEGRSGNTYGNPVDSAEIWRRDGFKSSLLVTSAPHMLRAIAAFRKAGMAIQPAATDALAGHNIPPFPLLVLPCAECRSETTNAVKELIGFAIYRWRSGAKHQSRASHGLALPSSYDWLERENSAFPAGVAFRLIGEEETEAKLT